MNIDLDEYVEGVLSGEASTLNSPQALEAMAIVIRTWALRNRGRHHAEGFDFCTLTHCQVYRLPATRSKPYTDAIIQAVRDTKGQVLEYESQLVDPYFGADCGGITESAVDLWPDKARPYLRVASDPYCAASSHSHWQRVVALDSLDAIIRRDMAEPLLGPLRGLTVASRDSSGRVRTLLARGDAQLEIDANEFRYAVDRRLGWAEIKSNLYTVERHGNDLVFTGRGLGHGVGLCQAGAEAMGHLGIGYVRILAQYFPGTSVVQLPAATTDPVASSEHFELDYPDAQQPWVSECLTSLEQSRKELEIPADAWPPKVRVQTWNRTVDFVNATGKPGWAAGTNDGRSIFLQPLETLDAKGILRGALRHELAHVAIHRLRAPAVPLWFEEGLTLYVTGERIEDDPASGVQRKNLGRRHRTAEVRGRDARRLRACESTGPAARRTTRTGRRVAGTRASNGG